MDITPQQISTDNAPRPGRRTFLRWLSAILGTIAAVVLSVPVVGYFFGLRKRSVFWVDLGAVTEFPLNETRRVNFDNPLRQPWDGVTALTGVYVRNEGKNNEGADQFRVLSVNCAHLGCPVILVPAVGTIHVPLSRRRLLRRWRAGFRTAAARLVSLRVAHSRWQAPNSGSALSRRFKTP